MYTYLNIYRTYNNLGCIGVFMYGILMFPLRTVGIHSLQRGMTNVGDVVNTPKMV